VWACVVTARWAAKCDAGELDLPALPAASCLQLRLTTAPSCYCRSCWACHDCTAALKQRRLAGAGCRRAWPRSASCTIRRWQRRSWRRPTCLCLLMPLLVQLSVPSPQCDQQSHGAASLGHTGGGALASHFVQCGAASCAEHDSSRSCTHFRCAVGAALPHLPACAPCLCPCGRRLLLDEMYSAPLSTGTWPPHLLSQHGDH
jgi:hypothetical protein